MLAAGDIERAKSWYADKLDMKPSYEDEGGVQWREGRRPAADLVVLVSVGKQHADDEFFVVPVGVLYDWAGARAHRGRPLRALERAR